LGERWNALAVGASVGGSVILARRSGNAVTLILGAETVGAVKREILGATVVGWAFTTAKSINASFETVSASVRIIWSGAVAFVINAGSVITSERSNRIPASFEGRAVVSKLAAWTIPASSGGFNSATSVNLSGLSGKGLVLGNCL
jgi:hypothetical protein